MWNAWWQIEISNWIAWVYGEEQVNVPSELLLNENFIKIIEVHNQSLEPLSKSKAYKQLWLLKDIDEHNE